MIIAEINSSNFKLVSNTFDGMDKKLVGLITFLRTKVPEIMEQFEAIAATASMDA